MRHGEGGEPAAIAAYLDKLCAQVRCKRAREGLRRELAEHLEDSCQALGEAGLPPEEAAARAVASMGDPVEAGQRLDRIHRPRLEWGVLIGVLLLVALGCIIEWGIGASMERMGGPSPDLGYHLGPLLIGIPALLLCCFADYSLLGRCPRALFWGYLAVCAAMVYAGHSPALNGLGLLLPLLFAGLLYRWRGDSWQSLIFGFGALSVGVLVIALFSGLVLTLSVFFTCLLLMAVALWRRWIDLPLWKGLVMLIVCTAALFLLCSGMLELDHTDWVRIFYRVFPYLDPEVASTGYAAYYGFPGVREVLSQARWVGGTDLITSAVGGAVAPEYALPTLSYCMITWVIARFGWAAGLLISAVILLVPAWMLRSALHIEAKLGRMTALACVLTFSVQTLLYLTANFGLHDLYGALPFLGGGWELIFDLALSGVLLSCYRGKDLLRERVKRPVHPYPRWLPRLELKLHAPQYEKGEIPQMLGLTPPPEEGAEEES